MRVSVSVLAFCALFAVQSYAQLVDLDPDWKEQAVPPPATYRFDRLIPIEMPRYVTMKIGLDPDSLTISHDGIVRYVVVATSDSGSRSVMFEGIWCRTGETKTYARAGSDGNWNAVEDALWRPLSGNLRSMHALALARQGVCDGRSAAAASPESIIRKLSQPAHAGFQK